ncbi:MAG: hypothetical protein B7Y07_03175 [Halothiobacillus sp. 24-54-40]|jgi:FkbM family methyltransferase|nr:MAG: hypothetical protein B7Y58_02850 [Halothiobacillus sp. 35-54-62]OYZ87694.1 MAG: hypothetical protein B7Y07_03175 [Halothiobacillus sp. 24-54-40]OZA81476.1 MAG: hypothetical protein B7X64_01130 [Halothiobacillus sp. 39-53-45]HQS02827.1 FkbM family methyltransferase [Halothiobacillus sp.]
MGIVSYAQNFEDVMLWRALGHVDKGFYIDVGANDPVVDSVSLIFHERGWSGIHIEPMTSYADLLRQQRPGDQIIQAAVGTEAAIIRFYEILGEGISTGDPDIAQQHRDRGFQVNEIRVPAITLNSILESCDVTEIHWMKIDVEGFEKKVISSWAPSKARPWVVVVESTLPMTQIPSYEEWESTLVGYGYSLVYFDGLNRYYLSEEHPELEKHFSAPPNVFDDFTLNRTAHAPFHRLIEMRYQSKIVEIEAQIEKQQQWTQAEIEHLMRVHEELNKTATHREEELKEQLKALTKKDETWSRNWAQRQNEHSGQIYELKQELEDILRAQILREQELSEQLLSVQQQAETEKTALRNHYQAQIETIQKERAELESLTSERIEALNEAIRQLHEAKIQREKEHTEHLLNVLPQTDADKAAIHEHYQAQLDRVQAEQAENEWLSSERIYALNEALHQLQAAKTQREQELFEQILNTQQRADEEKAAIHQHYQAQLEQIEHEQNEHRWLTEERIQSLNETVQQLRIELTQREQAHNEQLLSARHQAEEDKSALRQHYQTRMTEIQREQAEHEWLTSARIHKLNESLTLLHGENTKRELANTEAVNTAHEALISQLTIQTQREKAHSEQLTLIQQAALEKTNELTKVIREQSEVLISERNAAHQLLVKQQELELQLALKMKEHEKISSTLRSALNLETSKNRILKDKIEQQLITEKDRLESTNKYLLEIELEINNTITEISAHSKSFIKKLFARQNPQRLLNIRTKLHEAITSFDAASDNKEQFKTGQKPTINTMETEMSSNRKTTYYSPPVAAKTAPELFAHNDIDFVECAYMSILGREPDPEGMNYYLNRIRSGISKVEIAAQLIKSGEAGTYRPKIVGLKKEIRSFSIGRFSLIGWIYRVVNGLEGNGFSHRKLRAIENQLNLLKMQSKGDFEQLERSVSSLAGIVSRQAALTATNGLYPTSSVTAGDQPENNYMGFHRQIPHEADIFLLLKNEISLNNPRN